MAIAFVQAPNPGANVTATTVNLAYGSNTAAGSLLVAFTRVGSTTDGVTGLTDTQGNTWVLGGSQVQTTDVHKLWCHYAKNTVGGANTVTANIAGTGATIRFCILEISGADLVTPLDGIAGGQNNGTTLTGGSVTNTQVNVILVGAGSTGGNVTFTAGSGYTVRTVAPTAGTSRLGVETQVVGSITSYASTLTIGTGQDWAALTVIFKELVIGKAGPAVRSQALNRSYTY